MCSSVAKDKGSRIVWTDQLYFYFALTGGIFIERRLMRTNTLLAVLVIPVVTNTIVKGIIALTVRLAEGVIRAFIIALATERLIFAADLFLYGNTVLSLLVIAIVTVTII